MAASAATEPTQSSINGSSANDNSSFRGRWGDWTVTVDETAQPATVSVSKASLGAVHVADGDGGPEEETYKFNVSMVRGITCPPWLSASAVDEIDSKIRYRPSDVIVLTYPKCGTTWAEQVVLLLLHSRSCGEGMAHLNPTFKNTYRPGINPVGKIWPEAAINSNAGKL
jgi:hypothetical protein